MTTDTSPREGRTVPTAETLSRGNWMQTFTGKRFYPLDPRPEDIDPLDIAHALSMICRYGGHTLHHYSVAEHCLLMSYAVSPENALWALLHDATEAYVGDMVRPLKLMMPWYKDVENKVLDAIIERFGLSSIEPAEVKEADNRIILNERAAVLRPTSEIWLEDKFTPLDVEIRCLDQGLARAHYWARLMELGVEP